MEDILQKFDTLASKERLECMTQLISKLSLIERRKLLSILQAGPLINTTTVKPRLNILSYMPIELVEKIFKYLSWKELLECRSVCHSWHKFTHSNNLWYEMCKKYLSLGSINTAKIWLHLKDTTIHWETLFIWITKREQNWLYGKPERHIVIPMIHQGRVQKICLLPNDRMLTSSYDRSMALWRLGYQGKTEMLRKWESDSVIALDAMYVDESPKDLPPKLLSQSNLLVILSGHFDRCCIIWLVDDGVDPHMKPNMISDFTQTEETTEEMIAKETNIHLRAIYRLRQHRSPIRQVRLYKEYAITCGCAVELRLWHWKNGNLIRSIDHAELISDFILFHDEHLLAAYGQGMLRQMNIKSEDTDLSFQDIIMSQDIRPNMASSVRLIQPITMSGYDQQTLDTQTFIYATDKHMEWFKLDTMNASLQSLFSLDTEYLDIHMPFMVTEHRIICTTHDGIYVRLLPDTLRQDTLFNRQSSSWCKLVDRRKDLNNVPIVGLAVDACRLVVGCIDGSVHIFQMAPLVPFQTQCLLD